MELPRLWYVQTHGPHPNGEFHMPMNTAIVQPKQRRWFTTLLLLAMLLSPAMLTGCSSAKYGLMETFGYQKRDILVSRVETARDSQEEAKQQFRSALEKFMNVVGTPPSELQTTYEMLRDEHERSVARAKAVNGRVEAVEDVGEALFKEWEAELKQYKSDTLRNQSERELRQTRLRYDQLIAAMKNAESKMQPVLDAFSDQVLFLKHNLNAQAIASLKGTSAALQSDIQQLISDMEKSIAQANTFIEQMTKTAE